MAGAVYANRPAATPENVEAAGAMLATLQGLIPNPDARWAAFCHWLDDKGWSVGGETWGIDARGYLRWGVMVKFNDGTLFYFHWQ